MVVGRRLRDRSGHRGLRADDQRADGRPSFGIGREGKQARKLGDGCVGGSRRSWRSSGYVRPSVPECCVSRVYFFTTFSLALFKITLVVTRVGLVNRLRRSMANNFQNTHVKGAV